MKHFCQVTQSERYHLNIVPWWKRLSKRILFHIRWLELLLHLPRAQNCCVPEKKRFYHKNFFVLIVTKPTKITRHKTQWFFDVSNLFYFQGLIKDCEKKAKILDKSIWSTPSPFKMFVISQSLQCLEYQRRTQYNVKIGEGSKDVLLLLSWIGVSRLSSYNSRLKPTVSNWINVWPNKRKKKMTFR